ncbi:hypothetical protein [Cellvibrio sp. pealriver]|uniref:hypothetical protein n=1 Tax=Cellvibrio sp. pealriver TaxID=1622269 RepID=UPI00066FB64B|nr:hypothetical protein [Cellvibrio sp. pealriver]
MHTLKTTTIVSAAALSLLLSACGGGGDSPLINGGSSSVSSGTVDTTTPTSIGLGSGADFVAGQIGVGIGNATLSPGGSTTLTINVVSPTNTLVTNPVNVTFNSVCVASGEAILKNGDTTTNNVSTTNGQASITYTANGCVGNDEITASAVLAGSTKTARATLNIASDTIQTVSFIEADPTLVNLKGTGGKEVSNIRFRVLGATGAPMKGVDVDFSLSTSVGGLSLTDTTTKTDSAGYAKTTVQAGAVATTVRVTAKARGTEISTQSSQLIVSTGIPDQDSMSLSATNTFPIGAWNYDGIESQITIRMADAFNNPPPNGTAVTFTTEGGSIVSGCPTTDGACTVRWISQAPKPTRNSANNSVERILCVDAIGNPVPDADACALERAGRVTVLATAIGNESFIDANGNGYFDKPNPSDPDPTRRGDIFRSYNNGGDCDANVPPSSAKTPANSGIIPCDDLVEAYIDKNENGKRDPDEEFTDFNKDNAHTIENGMYNGVLCQNEGDGCTKTGVTIREDLLLVMNSTNMLFRNGVFPFINSNVKLKATPQGSSSSAAASSGASSSAGNSGPDFETIWFWMADENGHGLPAGTTLDVDTSNLKNADATIGLKGPIAASLSPARVNVTVVAATSGTPFGTFNIDITVPTPGGEVIYTQTVVVSAE